MYEPRWCAYAGTMQPLLKWAVRLAAACYAVLATVILLNEGAGLAVIVVVPLAAVPIAVAWRRPMPALIMLVVGVAVAWAVAPRAIMVGLLPLVYVLGPLAYRCRPAAAWAGLAAALGVVWLLGRPGGAIVFTVAFTPVWTVAYAARLHRVHTERLMAEHALRGLAEQRLRIARELHDIVAHGMSVITVQAGYGALVIDDQPGEARAALEAIETTGRRTLVEMRHLLGALRTDDGVDLEPVPAL